MTKQNIQAFCRFYLYDLCHILKQTEVRKTDRRLEQASRYIPPSVRAPLAALDRQTQGQSEELRLRVGQPLYLTVCGREQAIGSHRITPQDVQETLQKAAEYSMHTYADSLRQGFLTVQGGHRIGVGGQTAVEEGTIHSYRHVSSLNIRIARQIIGAAKKELLSQTADTDRLHNVLIFSPPGRGKTTLLRDMARQLSDSGIRTALADERCELAALYEGVPQFDIGAHTDVLDGCPKAQAAMILLKTMSPQLLVLDELTSEQDSYAAEYAAHCGTAVLASAHAWDVHDLLTRPLYQKLRKAAVFDRIFCIQRDRSVRCVTEQEGNHA